MERPPAKTVSELQQGEPVQLSVAIDHGQFFVDDRDAEIDTAAYSPEAFAQGYATWAGGVAIFGDAQWTEGTAMTVTWEEAAPDVSDATFDRVLEVPLSCASGELRVYAPEGTGVDEHALLLPPGEYMLLVGRERGEPDELGEYVNDRYELRLWPAA